MRRLVHTLALLAAAGTLTVAVPSSAAAATGVLIIDGYRHFENPSGCYDRRTWPLDVENRTDRTAYAWSGPNCTGLLVGWVGPGGHETFEADTVRIR
ncbi:hypothetical protein JNUCC64_16165 [Streptomyces sp. JNUCC 64]